MNLININYQRYESITLVRPRRVVFVTAYIPVKEPGLYALTEEMKMTDEPLLKNGAASCNTKKKTKKNRVK